ncbi:MAG: NAD-dependent epimerase/dehydratase family protein [Azospirillaceae bacterium]
MIDLVTGGAGFIGRHLVTRLLGAGRCVRVLDLAAPPDTLPDTLDVESVTGSVTDAGALKAAMDGVERVFHIAGLPDLWRHDPRDYERVNHLGTCRVVEAAAAAGVGALVHTSTAVVLAGADPRDPAATRVAGPYTRSKIAAESTVREAAAAGLRAVILRPGAPIGPGDTNRTPPTRLLADVVAGRLPAYLDAALAFVDVRDLAAAFPAAAARGTPGEAYVIAHPPVRLRRLFEIMATHMDVHPPRQRVPAPVAWAAAAVGEAVGRVTGRPPAGSIEGVRIAGRPLALDGRPGAADLGLSLRALEESVIDAVAWLEDGT